MIQTQQSTTKLPTGPGIYFFKNSAGDILYVGKATSLRDRVRSYFSSDIMHTRGPLIHKMLSEYTTIDFVATDSVLEALMLEANLIRQHQPLYNSKEKDNKSYNYVVITKEDFPKVLSIRGRTIHSIFPREDIKYVFGPFPHGAQLKEALGIIRNIFPYTDKKCIPASIQLEKGKKPKPCFNYQIGLCPGVCIGKVTKEEYAETIKHIKLFFEGKKHEVIKNLTHQMNLYASNQEFEKADEIKKTIFSLNHIQDIALLKRGSGMNESVGGAFASHEKSGGVVERVEAYDVAHLFGSHVVGVMTVVEDGDVVPHEYRKFKIKIQPGINDISALKEIIRRRLGHPEWILPHVIVVDGGQAQINAARNVLQERGFDIPVISVVKDDRHKPKDILGDKKNIEKYRNQALLANAEAHRFAVGYHRSLRRRNMI